MGCIIVTSFYRFPDGREILQKDLYFPEERDIMELRKKTNWVKGSHGHFAGSVSNGAGGYTKMSKSERNRVSHEIATWHPNYKSGSSHCGEYGDYFYGFNVIMPGSYHFTLKMKIVGNEDAIKRKRGLFND